MEACPSRANGATTKVLEIGKRVHGITLDDKVRREPPRSAADFTIFAIHSTYRVIRGLATIEEVVTEAKRHRRLGPRQPAAVPVSGAVRRRAGDRVTSQVFGDRVQAAPVDVFAEDAGDDRRGLRVGFEAVQSLPGRGLAGAGVRAGVDQLVAAGRPAAEEPRSEGGRPVSSHCFRHGRPLGGGDRERLHSAVRQPADRGEGVQRD